MKILIVDDSEDARVLLETALTAKGHTVEAAVNGKQGLEMAGRSRPDVIISDILMPEMDGFALCQAMKDDEQLRTVPFVFLTASYITSKDKELALALGAERFLVKTGDTGELLETVEEILEKYKGGRIKVPSQPTMDKEELERLHKDALIRQLDKKMRELEKEHEALLESEEKYRKLIETANDGIVLIDIETNIILNVNKRIEELIGESAEKIVGKDVTSLFPKEESERYLQLFEKYSQLQESVTTEDIFISHKDGRRIPVEISSNVLELGGKKSIQGIFRDLSERKQLLAQIDYVARYDAVTGLPNRVLFCEHLSQAIAQAQGKKQQLAVLYIYPGQLSKICESLGRKVCDFLCQTIAERIKESVREKGGVAPSGGVEDTKTIGRLREHEFAVLLPQIASAQDAMKVAKKAIKVSSKTILLDNREISLPCRIGISVYPADGSDEETLLKNAAIAMSNIKETGEGDFQFYSPKMGALVSDRMALEDDLRRVLEREELVVHYQPQVDLRTGQIAGMEALIRWRHADRGIVSPLEFIPIAEETGQIVPIGEWVLHTACAQNRAWYDAGFPPIRMSVNFSAHQLIQQDVIGTLTRTIKETGLGPEYLEMEITESAFMKGMGITIATLTELNEMGIRIAIDDFGTGYSSLSYLKSLPVTELKIDRSFVRDLTTNPDDDALVTAIIAMAHSLNLKVIAEGVETRVQLEFLCSLKCDKMQGYLFSKPLPAEEATKLLAEGRRLEL